MKHIHHHIRIYDGIAMLFVIFFRVLDEGNIIDLDRVAIHPILMNGKIGEDISMPDQEMTIEIYSDVLGMLQVDGVI